ncbi:MAG: glycerol-3-phosphate acyltransferase [Acidobacteriota bacterium]
MNETLLLILLILFGYFLGAIPFSVLVGRSAKGVNILKVGSRNPGAANVFRNVGWLAGVGVALADAAKGAVPVALALALGLPAGQSVWPGLAAVIGHDFPVYMRFRGGKGGATTCGYLGCFVFPELLVALVVWAILWLAVRRHRFVGSILALSLTPILIWWFRWTWPIRLPSTDVIVAVSMVLMLLLWLRILPGLRERRRLG